MWPKYLGDGVYLNYDGYHYILYTESEDNMENKIYLDPEVLAKLIKELT